MLASCKTRSRHPPRQARNVQTRLLQKGDKQVTTRGLHRLRICSQQVSESPIPLAAEVGVLTR
jgi:hypothetical protein